ncbi:MAG: FkbM family methyltransferase [Calothrix sp. MO_192.B10]|nr:FkbM family methyltransferase [Calothrix sp. MO_192.B10]
MNKKVQIKLVLHKLLQLLFGEENVPYMIFLFKQKFLNKFDRNAYYDWLTTRILKRALHDDSICVDIGCHRGDILSLMLKYSPKGKFLAFEPLPIFYEYLLNNFHVPNVKIYDIALSDKKGITSFNYVVNNPAYSGLQKRQYINLDEKVVTIDVKTDTIDDIISNDEKISLIKIDVEGAELQVLKGGQHTIKRNQPIIIFEHGLGGSDFYGTQPEDIYDLLCLECGLKISLLDSWLNDYKSLSREEFTEQFYKGLNYYFIAHP